MLVKKCILKANLRTKKSYLIAIRHEPKQTQNAKALAIKKFEEFCSAHYKTTPDEIIEELQSSAPDDRSELVAEVYRTWINFMIESVSIMTSKTYYYNLKTYMEYRKISTNEKIKFPKCNKEVKYPLHMNEIQMILGESNYKRKGLYLALLSSGMRIGEAVQIRKKDIDFALDRIKVNIAGKYTKTRQARTVFISKEAMNYTKFAGLRNDDLVWGGNQNRKRSVGNEIQYLKSVCKKVGLSEKYDSGTGKITLHSFRAYFFTKAV